MTNFKIVVFEDNHLHVDGYTKEFENCQILFYKDPDKDWKVPDEVINDIHRFSPDFVIVDLVAEKNKDADKGLRVIRRLVEEEKTKSLKIAAISVLFNAGDSLEVANVEKVREKAEGYGAFCSLAKSSEFPNFVPTADIILDALELS